MTGTPAKQRYTFTSYLCAKALNGSEDGNGVNNSKVKLLPGELEVARAHVFLYPPTVKITDDNENEAVSGLVVVTNFKLSFMADRAEEQQGPYQENLFLGKNDVTLNNIDVVYQIIDKKKKRLLPQQQQKISSKIEALHIVCKNFRLLKFSFKNMAKDQGKVIAAALAKFAYPSRIGLSFGYFFEEKYYNTVKSTVTMFNSKNDWSRELIRCGATEWRVLSAESLQSTQLPKYFVIPKCCTVDMFGELSTAFCDARSAFWVYSFGVASLIRMGEVRTDADTKWENVSLELVRKCDPDKKSLHIIILSTVLPTIQDIQRGYLRFRELCTPDSPRQFLVQDAKFLSLVDKSGWLLYVSLCLKTSAEAAETLRKGQTVVLQENNARDLCCVISSLTQILLDPFFRTIDGFQSLIQKDWVALEHPFMDRLGHVVDPESDKESPVLLLFLDCVWQLLQQFPEEFEFSQTYLTTIWDSAFLPIFDTFQFNSETDRVQATMKPDQKMTLRPIWDWSEQFADKDKIFFTNPFYTKKMENVCRKTVVIPPNAIALPGLQKAGSRLTIDSSAHFANHSTVPKNRYLMPCCGISHLEIWQQCYFRWIPLLEIKRGGFPQVDLFHRLLLSNIAKLQRSIETCDFEDVPDVWAGSEADSSQASSEKKSTSDDEVEKVERRIKSNNATPTNSPTRHIFPVVNSFFPFSLSTEDDSGASQLTDILTSSNELLLMEGSIMERLSIAQLPD